MAGCSRARAQRLPGGAAPGAEPGGGGAEKPGKLIWGPGWPPEGGRGRSGTAASPTCWPASVNASCASDSLAHVRLGPAAASSISPSSLPHPRADSSDKRNQGAIGSYSEWFAAALGNLKWLRFCLDPDLEEIPTDNKGFSAIHFAAQSCQLECLQVLVEEYKFPVDLPTNNGQTPLHLVIHKENKNMVLPCIHYLLEHGASLNTPSAAASLPTLKPSHWGMSSPWHQVLEGCHVETGQEGLCL